ncbi:MAG: preprotein translocase subunit SecG [Oligoflexia bacterium]|nr:preprotein translocase subunit SecG [Oligoflexia bacterium]
MSSFVTVIHVITCVLLVLLVLIQSGKGADISASFGGSSQTVFGSSGGANFFVRFTQGAAAVFMITSLALTIMGSQSKKSIFEQGSGGAAAPTGAVAPTGAAPAGAIAPTGAAPAQPAANVPAEAKKTP